MIEQRRYRKHGERRGVVRRRAIKYARTINIHFGLPEGFDLAARLEQFAADLAAALAVPMDRAAQALWQIGQYMNQPDVEQTDRATPTALPIPRNSRADDTADFRRERGYDT